MADKTPKTTSADNDTQPDKDIADLPNSDASEAVITGSGSLDKPYNAN